MSSLTRIYLPLTAADLDELATSHELSLDGRLATGVTDSLRESAPQDDDEGWEFTATQDAAAATADGQRVVVAAADVPDDKVQPAGGEIASAVTVSGVLSRQRVASLHLGDEGVRPEPGEELELSWYDITELDEVRRLLGDD